MIINQSIAMVAVGMTMFAPCLAATVSDVTARQRYPWNGKVDVDVTLNGDSGKTYRVVLTAKDLDGGTNLPVKTAWVDGGDVTNGVFLLAPGRHRLVWDADADITADGDFSNVAVSILADGWETENLRIAERQTVYSGVVLTWDANDNADGYNDYRTVGSVAKRLATVAATTYTDGLPYGVDATYCVRAVFAGREGADSNAVSARGMAINAPEGALVYLPMDGEEIYDATDENPHKVESYGSEPLFFHRQDSDLAWTWLADRKGREPGAMYAEGRKDSLLRFPGLDEFCISNSFTVAFWCRPELGLSKIVEEKDSGNYGVLTVNYPYVLGSMHGGDTGEAGFGIAVGTNGIAVVEHAGDWFPATLVYASEIGMNWTHVAVTMEENGAPALYVNGAKVRTGKSRSR